MNPLHLRINQTERFYPGRFLHFPIGVDVGLEALQVCQCSLLEVIDPLAGEFDTKAPKSTGNDIEALFDDIQERTAARP